MADVAGEMARANVMMDMLAERENAFAKYGDQSERGDELWSDIVAARVDLIDRAIRTDGDVYKEVLQAATILMAWAENLNREGANG